MHPTSEAHALEEAAEATHPEAKAHTAEAEQSAVTPSFVVLVNRIADLKKASLGNGQMKEERKRARDRETKARKELNTRGREKGR